jgi:hypothetical protein
MARPGFELMINRSEVDRANHSTWKLDDKLGKLNKIYI